MASKKRTKKETVNKVATKKVAKKKVATKKVAQKNVPEEKEVVKRGPRANSVSAKLKKLLDVMYEKTGEQPSRQAVIERVNAIRAKHPEFDPSNALIGVVMCNWRKERKIPALRKRASK